MSSPASAELLDAVGSDYIYRIQNTHVSYDIVAYRLYYATFPGYGTRDAAHARFAELLAEYRLIPPADRPQIPPTVSAEFPNVRPWAQFLYWLELQTDSVRFIRGESHTSGLVFENDSTRAQRESYRAAERLAEAEAARLGQDDPFDLELNAGLTETPF